MGNCGSSSGDTSAIPTTTTSNNNNAKPSAASSPAPPQKVKGPVDLYNDDINLSKVISLLQNPTERVQAIRLHGSRNVQNMLGEVSSSDQMAMLLNASSNDGKDGIPVVVLVAGDLDNVQSCARFTLEAWQTMMRRLGTSDPGNQPDASRSSPPWLVSNHSMAVSLEAMDTVIPQSDLPLGCRG